MSFILENKNGVNTITGNDYHFFAYDESTTEIRISPLIESGVTQSKKTLFASNTEADCQIEAISLGFTIIVDEDPE